MLVDSVIIYFGVSSKLVAQHLGIKIRPCSHATRRIFDQLENLAAHFVHRELFSVFALLTWNCLTRLNLSEVLTSAHKQSAA